MERSEKDMEYIKNLYKSYHNDIEFDSYIPVIISEREKDEEDNSNQYYEYDGIESTYELFDKETNKYICFDRAVCCVCEKNIEFNNYDGIPFCLKCHHKNRNEFLQVKLTWMYEIPTPEFPLQIPKNMECPHIKRTLIRILRTLFPKIFKCEKGIFRSLPSVKNIRARLPQDNYKFYKTTVPYYISEMYDEKTDSYILIDAHVCSVCHSDFVREYACCGTCEEINFNKNMIE